MKFRAAIAPTPASPGVGASRGKPDWLKEWLENRAHYVRLSCGHMEDLAYGALLIIARFGSAKTRPKDRIVMCERCNVWAYVERTVTMREYFGLPPRTIEQDPLF